MDREEGEGTQREPGAGGTGASHPRRRVRERAPGVAAAGLGLAILTQGFEHKPLFVDATAATGLDFVHFNGMSGELYMAEMMGGGGALLDYDNDGDLDVFAVQGRMLGARGVERAVFPPRHQPPFSDRLYRNDLRPGPGGTPSPHFVDVTVASRLGALAGSGYGMGAATGDYDGDGFVDIYVLELGANRLLRNLGNGKFQDV